MSTYFEALNQSSNLSDLKFGQVYDQLVFQALKVSMYQSTNKGDDIGDVNNDVGDVGGVIIDADHNKHHNFKP